MKIILSCLYKQYKTYTGIANILGASNLKKLKKGGNVSLRLIASKFDLKAFNYTYEDFLSDYSQYTTQYKEKYAIFFIWSQGKTIEKYANENNIPYGTLFGLLKRGFETKNSYQIIPLELRKQALCYDFSRFETIFQSNYMILIGTEIDLLDFQKHFNIIYPVLPYDNVKYHLAFDGIIFEELKIFLS